MGSGKRPEGVPPPRAEAQDVLVTRPQFDPEPELLPKGAGRFIARLIAGHTTGAALEDDLSFDLTATLGLLIRSGAITQIIPGEPK